MKRALWYNNGKHVMSMIWKPHQRYLSRLADIARDSEEKTKYVVHTDAVKKMQHINDTRHLSGDAASDIGRMLLQRQNDMKVGQHVVLGYLIRLSVTHYRRHMSTSSLN